MKRSFPEVVARLQAACEERDKAWELCRGTAAAPGKPLRKFVLTLRKCAILHDMFLGHQTPPEPPEIPSDQL